MRYLLDLRNRFSIETSLGILAAVTLGTVILLSGALFWVQSSLLLNQRRVDETVIPMQVAIREVDSQISGLFLRQNRMGLATTMKALDEERSREKQEKGLDDSLGKLQGALGQLPRDFTDANRKNLKESAQAILTSIQGVKGKFLEADTGYADAVTLALEMRDTLEASLQDIDADVTNIIRDGESIAGVVRLRTRLAKKAPSETDRRLLDTVGRLVTGAIKISMLTRKLGLAQEVDELSSVVGNEFNQVERYIGQALDDLVEELSSAPDMQTKAKDLQVSVAALFRKIKDGDSSLVAFKEKSFQARTTAQEMQKTCNSLTQELSKELSNLARLGEGVTHAFREQSELITLRNSIVITLITGIAVLCAILSVFIIKYNVKELRATNNMLRRLQSRLERILVATRDFASTHEKAIVALKAAGYILPQVNCGEAAGAKAYFFEDSNNPNSPVSEAILVEGGKPVKQPELQACDSWNFDGVELAFEINGCYVNNRREVIVPLQQEGKRYGFLTFHPLASESLVADESHFLDTIASSLTSSLQNIEFLSAIKGKFRMEAELMAAKSVQDALIPSDLVLPGVTITSTYETASSTGGDWFGYYYNEAEHRLYFYVGDVTGHGVPSALLTGVVCGAVYSEQETMSLYGQGLTAGVMPAEERLSNLASILNSVVLRTGKKRLLMTMAFLSLDLTTGEVVFLNAAHNFPMWVQTGQGKIKEIPARGSRLGHSDEPEFATRKFTIVPNDTVFLFTDGLIENMGPNGETIPVKRLKEIISQGASLTEIKQSIVEETRAAWKGTEPADDFTILMFTWEGPIPREAWKNKGVNSMAFGT